VGVGWQQRCLPRVANTLALLLHVSDVRAVMFVCADEKQLLEFQQQEVDALQHKVATFRTDLKTEMKHAKKSNEAHVRHLLFASLFL